MTTPTITPQELPNTSPTYQEPNTQDYVRLNPPTTFLYYYNSTASPVSLVISAAAAVAGSYNCYVVSLPATTETLIGPFDYTLYGSMLSISTADPTGLLVAAFSYGPTVVTQTVIPGCTAASSTPTIEVDAARTQSIIPTCTTASSTPVVRVEPPAEIVVNGTETLKIIVRGSEPIQTIILAGVESQKIIVLGSE